MAAVAKFGAEKSGTN